MNHIQIIDLMKEMNQSDLTKIEIEQENFKLIISKEVMIHERPVNPCTVTNGSQMRQPVVTEIQTGSIGQVQTQSLVLEAVNVSNQEALHTECIKSPMVGTFYEKPAPDQPTFVKVGDRVKKGQVICIIEAMKLMNEIECDFDGEIEEILAKNEEMVEYGQPLFKIKNSQEN